MLIRPVIIQNSRKSVSTGEPIPTISFTYSPLEPVENESIQFTSTVTGNVTSYLWNFDDGTTSNLANPTHTYNVHGTYSVSCQVESLGGTSQFTATVVVDEVTLPSSQPTATNNTISQDDSQIIGTYTYNSDLNILENNPPPEVKNVSVSGQPFVGETLTINFDFFSPSGYLYDSLNSVIKLYRKQGDEDPVFIEDITGTTYVPTISDIGYELIFSIIAAQTTAVPNANGNPLSVETFSPETNTIQFEFNPDILFDSYYRNENIASTWTNTGFGTGTNAISVVGNEPIINQSNNRVDFNGNQWFEFTSPGTSNGIPYCIAFRFSKALSVNMRLLELGSANSLEFRGNGRLRFDSSSLQETSFLFQNNTDYIIIIQHTMNVNLDLIVSVYSSIGQLINTETITGGTKSPRGLGGTLGSDDGVAPFTGWIKEIGIKVGEIFTPNDIENILNRLSSL